MQAQVKGSTATFPAIKGVNIPQQQQWHPNLSQVAGTDKSTNTHDYKLPRVFHSGGGGGISSPILLKLSLEVATSSAYE